MTNVRGSELERMRFIGPWARVGACMEWLGMTYTEMRLLKGSEMSHCTSQWPFCFETHQTCSAPWITRALPPSTAIMPIGETEVSTEKLHTLVVFINAVPSTILIVSFASRPGTFTARILQP